MGQMMEYMAKLAEEGGALLASMWNTHQMPADSAERSFMQAALANVRVPCGYHSEPACPSNLSATIVKEHQMYVPLGEFAGKGHGTWARVSASVYNQLSDFKKFGDAVLQSIHGAPLTV